jgi:hypothetical protein
LNHVKCLHTIFWFEILHCKSKNSFSTVVWIHIDLQQRSWRQKQSNIGINSESLLMITTCH